MLVGRPNGFRWLSWKLFITESSYFACRLVMTSRWPLLILGSLGQGQGAYVLFDISCLIYIWILLLILVIWYLIQVPVCKHDISLLQAVLDFTYHDEQILTNIDEFPEQNSKERIAVIFGKYLEVNVLVGLLSAIFWHWFLLSSFI